VKEKTKSKQSHAEKVVERFSKIFQAKLGWNAARLDCFALLVVGMLLQRTVNLVLIGACNHRETKKESAYRRRLQRFFSEFAMPLDDIGRLVVNMLPRPVGGWVVAVDRTNWKFGRKHINVLLAGVVLGKVCFPVAWMTLPKRTKKGNSNASQRIRLFKRLLQIIPANSVRAVVMDREFIGAKWLSWLDQQGLGYVVRVKHNTLVGNMHAAQLSRRNRWKRFASTRFEVFGQQVFFASKSMTAQRGDCLQVISNRFSARHALDLYRLRWGIEVFFSHLKTRGLHFEDTHLCDPRRIERLVAVLAVVFVFAFRHGSLLASSNPVPVKKHGFPSKSLFRLSLEDFFSLSSLSLDLFLLLIFYPPSSLHTLFVV
jgi:hypothetical protein